MSNFHLRPVSETSPSPSPTAPTTPPGDHSPPFKGPSSLHVSPPPPSSTNGRSHRRPLSPSSLRGVLSTSRTGLSNLDALTPGSDVDLTRSSDMPPRKYPAPPTGHDLMAMFPPAPPDSFSEMRPGPTSGYFQRQERAFFAQAGKEIVRVRVEVDLPENEPPKSSRSSSSRPWPGHSTPIPHHSSPPSSSAPLGYSHPTSRPPQRGPVPATGAPLFPTTPSHAPPSQHPSDLHPHQTNSGLRTPPQDPTQPGAPSSKTEPQPDEYDPDESWRRPMPYAERRRAGKHTKRVIVRT